MKKKRIISIITTLVILLLVLANIPKVTAHVPTGPPGDPPLDPIEMFYATPGGAYSFFYGHKAEYGSYIRDFQWLSPGFGWDRYIGMLSITNIWINGEPYTFDSPAVARAIFMIAPNHDQLTFIYQPAIDINGDIHNIVITFDIWHTPPMSPVPGSDLLIDIIITDNIIWNSGLPFGWVFDVSVRADLDIADLANPAADFVHVYRRNPSPPPQNIWQKRRSETTWNPPNRVSDPLYNMEVMMNDTNMSSTWPASPWAGIVPPWALGNPAGDTFYLVLYNPPPWPWEYLGPPINYQTGQAFPGPGNSGDIVVWDDTSLFIPPLLPPPPVFISGVTNLQIWMQ